MKHLSVVGLICLAVILYMGKSYERSLQPMDSSVHARLALDITKGPLHLPVSLYSEGGHWAQGFNDHPFTLFYLNGKIMRALEPSAFSARLLPTLFSVGCVLALYALVLSVGGSPAAGLAAGFILLFTPQFIVYGSRFQLDSAYIFFILLSFLAWVRGYPLAAGAAVAAGLIVKSPVALLLYPSVLALALIRGRIRQKLLWWNMAKALALTVLLTALFWLNCAEIGSGALVWDYWRRQVFGTAVQARYGGRTPVLPMLYQLGLRFHLWSLLLFAALAAYAKARRWRAEHSQTIFLVPAAITMLVISAIGFRFEHYYLPFYPFAAGFIALGLSRWLEPRTKALQGIAILLPMLVATLAVAFPISFGGEKFPQLRYFNTLIRSYGPCTDHVLFVEGGQPYGGAGDYGAVISFYTNRRVHYAGCENLAATLPELKPQWVIVSDEAYARCGGALAGFPTRWRHGNQQLLSSHPAPTEPLDLSRFDASERATADCTPPAPKESRYFKARR